MIGNSKGFEVVNKESNNKVIKGHNYIFFYCPCLVFLCFLTTQTCSADKELHVYRLKQQVVLCTRSDNTSLAQTAGDFQLLYVHEIWPSSAGKVYFQCGLLQFYYHVLHSLKCKLVLMGF